jgi:polysaccharide export outer membrane protein
MEAVSSGFWNQVEGSKIARESNRSCFMKMFRMFSSLGIAAYCAIFTIAVCQGQQIAGNSDNAIPTPHLQPSPSAVLRSFEPDVNEEYTLGAGDEIAIDFPGRTDLSTKQVIGPDGRITLDIAGPIKVGDMTREAAAQAVADKLSPYYTDLTKATVQVVKYGSNQVLLMGNVLHPGEISFDQTPTLLEALSRGGIPTRPDGSVPEQCVIYRGDQVLWVDLQGLLESGNPLANLRLRRNDLIFVPALSDRSVSVIGQVQHPGAVTLKRNSTLASIIGDAGGPSDAAGSNPNIEIVHKANGGATQYIRFRDLLKPSGGLEIALAPGDVVFVPKSGLAKTGFAMQQLTPFAMLGTFASLAIAP